MVSEEHVEEDDLNMHECMATFTKLLDHMEVNKITTQLAKVRIISYSTCNE